MATRPRRTAFEPRPERSRPPRVRDVIVARRQRQLPSARHVQQPGGRERDRDADQQPAASPTRSAARGSHEPPIARTPWPRLETGAQRPDPGGEAAEVVDHQQRRAAPSPRPQTTARIAADIIGGTTPVQNSRSPSAPSGPQSAVRSRTIWARAPPRTPPGPGPRGRRRRDTGWQLKNSADRTTGLRLPRGIAPT